MFCGHFAQFGISVQRRRLRASMDRVKLTRNDPLSVLYTVEHTFLKLLFPMGIWMRGSDWDRN